MRARSLFPCISSYDFGVDRERELSQASTALVRVHVETKHNYGW